MEKTIKKLLSFIGEDPEREGLKETPARIIKAYTEWFSGYAQNPESVIKTFNSDNDQMVIVKNIDYYSFCEHHMIPFYGTVSIGYLPRGRVLGVSKFARLIDIFARRLQIQENLTKQIADSIMKYVQPAGCGVIVNGIHLCMRSRGVQKQNSEMITSVMLGSFRDNLETREEFLNLLNR